MSNALVPSSADRLLPEVICEIIGYFASPLNVNYPSTFPWYLGHICSAWRRVFLSMLKAFWSEIRFHRTPEHNYPAYNERVRLLIKMFLERNKGLPFSFQWLILGHPSETGATLARSSLVHLISHSMRWKNAILGLDVEEIHMLGLLKGRLPLLESLTLTIRTGASRALRAAPEEYSDIFKDAPSLRALTLERTSNWNFNWSSLTTLQLKEMSFDHHTFVALSQATNLEKLMIWDTDGSMVIPSEVAQITFPSLRLLRTHGSTLLSILKTPVLDELHISFEDMEEEEITHFRTIRSFLRRSGCTVHNFLAEYSEEMEFVEVLKYLPDLTSLKLDCNGSPGNSARDVVMWLVSGGAVQNSTSLRRLQSLKICGPVQVAYLTALVVSRSRNVVENGVVLVEQLKELQYGYGRDNLWNRSESLGWAALERVCEFFGVQAELKL